MSSGPRKLDDLLLSASFVMAPLQEKFFLKALQMRFVQVVGEALDEGDTLAPVALLHADVHLRLIAAFLIGVREGVEVLI